MNFYQILKSSSLYGLRILFNNFPNNYLNIHSSIFFAKNTYYLIIRSFENVKLEELDYVEQYIYKWGVAQIEDSIEYIQIESLSKLVTNGREICLNNQYSIIRTYYGLSEIMAILNITTDSFSDGNKYNSIDKAMQYIETVYLNGVKLVDIGFESTRPNAVSKTSAEEIHLIKQFLPKLIALKKYYPDLRFSIDSYHEHSIKHLLNYDIDYINDVSGSLDISIIKKLHQNNIKYIAMHSLDIPVIKDNIIDINFDPTEFILNWQLDKIAYYEENNLDLGKIIFDPGIGFGNNPAQAFSIIRNLFRLRKPLLIGFSRKSLFTHLSSKPPQKRDIYTASLAFQLDGKVNYLRVHDIMYLQEMLQLKSNL